RRHQPHTVAKPPDRPPPVMRGRARLHPDQAGPQLLKERQHVTAPGLAPNNHRPCRIDTMDLEHRLGEINADRDNLSHWMAPLFMWSLTATTSWHSDAGWGAVHSITSGRLSRSSHSGRPALRNPSARAAKS